MSNYLTDIMSALGFLLLIGGVLLAFGPAWAMMLGGVLLMTVGVLAAWRRSR